MNSFFVEIFDLVAFVIIKKNKNAKKQECELILYIQHI